MKLNRIISPGLLAGIVFCSVGMTSTADDIVPCLIFTGNSDAKHHIDLSKQNRITFGEEGMTISSTADNDIPDVMLLYSLFNRIEFGDANPTPPAGVEEVEIDADSRLIFTGDSKSIVIESTSELPFSIGIFSTSGTLIATSEAYAGQSLSVEALTPQAYIAVASDGRSKLILKFIIK